MGIILDWWVLCCFHHCKYILLRSTCMSYEQKVDAIIILFFLGYGPFLDTFKVSYLP